MQLVGVLMRLRAQRRGQCVGHGELVAEPLQVGAVVQDEHARSRRGGGHALAGGRGEGRRRDRPAGVGTAGCPHDPLLHHEDPPADGEARLAADRARQGRGELGGQSRLALALPAEQARGGVVLQADPAVRGEDHDAGLE